MNGLVFTALAVAGGLGAMLRLLVDGVIRSRSRGSLPWGTIAINLSGSFLLGLIIGLSVSESWELIIGTGFLGGYTTFSTASFETVRLLQEHRWVAGAANGLGVLVAAICVAALGLWVGAAA